MHFYIPVWVFVPAVVAMVGWVLIEAVTILFHD